MPSNSINKTYTLHPLRLHNLTLETGVLHCVENTALEVLRWKYCVGSIALEVLYREYYVESTVLRVLCQ